VVLCWVGAARVKNFCCFMRVMVEAMKRVERKNIQKLSLEEALDLKVFIHVGAIVISGSI